MPRRRKLSEQSFAVLDALAQAGEEWSHGYDLCRGLGLQSGTVYPILIRLAERGLIETAWETGPPRGRPARHLYQIAPGGAELVAQHRREVASRRRTTSAGRAASSLGSVTPLPEGGGPS